MSQKDSLGSGTLLHPLAHGIACTALCMMPVGYFYGVGIIFHWLFLAQAASVIAAAGLSSLYLARCAYRSLWSTPFLLVCFALLIAGGGLEFIYAMSSKQIYAGDLFTAQFWNHEGRIHYANLSWHVPSYYPSLFRASLVEAVRILPWWTIGLYQLLLGLIAAGLLSYTVYKETNSPETAVLSALFLLSLPLAISNASVSFGLAGIMLFFVLFLSHGLNWAHGRGGFFTITAAGLALGYLAQSHYAGIMLVPVSIFLLFFVSISIDRTFSGAFIACFWLSILTALLVLPVLMVNLIFIGNPVYPLARNYFGGSFFDGPIQFDPILRSAQLAHSASTFHITEWKQALRLPVLLRFACIVLSAGLSFFCLLRFRWLVVVLLSLGIYSALVVHYFPPSFAYFVPVAPLICILASIAMVHVSKLILKDNWLLATSVILGLQVAIFAFTVSSSVATDDALKITNNLLRANEPPQAVGSLGSLVAFVNEDKSVKKLFLVCMPNSLALYQKPIISIDSQDSKRFAEFIRSAGNEHEIYWDLRRKYGVSHVAVQANCMQNTVTTMLPSKGKKRFAAFAKRYLVNVYSNDSYDVFRLEDTSGTS
ncbi:MAG: hypothetical protein KDD62_03020 [Bdellovibrionales bacterium]|nr:hypothetical protein [Bdellovibrionales bacterium]